MIWLVILWNWKRVREGWRRSKWLALRSRVRYYLITYRENLRGEFEFVPFTERSPDNAS